HRHRVRGLTAGVEVEDRLIDGFVSGLVEVIALHRLDAVGDGVLRHEHRAEHALLGLDVLRRGPQTVIALIVAHLSSSSFKFIGTRRRPRSAPSNFTRTRARDFDTRIEDAPDTAEAAARICGAASVMVRQGADRAPQSRDRPAVATDTRIGFATCRPRRMMRTPRTTAARIVRKVIGLNTSAAPAKGRTSSRPSPPASSETQMTGPITARTMARCMVWGSIPAA